MDNRLDKLRRIMQQSEIDIMALVPGANLRYLTGGIHYMLERPIVWFVPLDRQPIAVIPEMERPLFARHRIESNLFAWHDSEGYEGAFKAAFPDMKAAGKTIGVEGLHMRYFESQIIANLAPGCRIKDMHHALADLRIIKEPDEIAALRHAVNISEEALRETLKRVQIGMSEIDIANILEANLKAAGGDGLAFGTILHGGGNSSLPHSGPLDYRIQPGDPLLFDFGATYQGYCADITRTVFVRDVSDEFRAFYEVVRAAAKPGVTAESVDAAARAVIRDAGYESLMRARIGHGLGLEVHEPPYIVSGSKRILEPGMMFTVEPGIYKMDVIGVRIEDDVLVTPDEAESLSTFPREVIILDI